MDEQTLAQLTIHVDRLNKTVYGNGEPGLDELMRSAKHTTDRIEATLLAMQQAEKHGRQKLTWLLIAAVVGIVITLVSNWLSVGFRQWVSPPIQQQQNLNVKPSSSVDPVAYSTRDMAMLLGLSEREITDRAAKGEIPGAYKDGKAWRYDRAIVDAAFAAQAATAASAASAEATR